MSKHSPTQGKIHRPPPRQLKIITCWLTVCPPADDVDMLLEKDAAPDSPAAENDPPPLTLDGPVGATVSNWRVGGRTGARSSLL